MANSVVHFEVMTGDDAGALQRFYSEAFGWEVDTDNPMNYGMIPSVGTNVSGGIGQSQDGSNSVTVYVGVDDVDAAVKRVEELGGKLAFGPMEIPGSVTFAHVLDPAGNRFGLSKM